MSSRKPKPKNPIIRATHPIARGLVGAFAFSEKGGLSVRDQGRFHYDQIFTNKPTLPDWVVGEQGYELNFSGGVTGPSTIGTGDKDVRGTILTWFNPDDIGPIGICATVESAGSLTSDRGLQLGSEGTGILKCHIYDGAHKYANSVNSVIVGQLNQGGMTFDGVNLKVYLNGINEGTTSAGNPYTGYTTPEFEIGFESHQAAANRYMRGRIHQVLRWNRALLAGEIWQLYLDPYLLYKEPKRIKGFVPAAPPAVERVAGIRTLSLTGAGV